MIDEDLRKLEKEVKTNPGDEAAQVKLFNARARVSGQSFKVYWKIREKRTGHYSTGRLTQSSYGPRDLFTVDGKQWDDKNVMYTFLKKGIQKKEAGLAERLKRSEIVEFQTLTLESVLTDADMNNELNSLELEILRAEKEANLKRIKELEAKEQKLLSKTEGKKES